MGGCENHDTKLAKLCMISTQLMQFLGIIMNYNELTDQSIVGILNIIPKTGGHQEVIPVSATWYLRLC